MAAASSSIQDCGYYYEGSNVHAAAAALLQAMTQHDTTMDEYNAKVMT